MKRSLVYIVLVIALAGVAIGLYLKENSNTVNQKLTSFAIEDTSAVTKIFMADKSNNSITLERAENNVWLINGKEKARVDMVNNLLKTMKELKVRTPVAKSMHNNVVRHLGGNSVKVEIYLNNDSEPTKVYYVGGPNADHTGSFMLLEGSSVPYVMHLEGHYGYLSSRYSANKNVWRDNYIWQFPGKRLTQIETIKVTNHRSPEKGFKLSKESDENYQVFDAQGNLRNYNSSKVLSYLRNYESVAFEGYEETKNEGYLDSLFKSALPMYSIELTTTNGESTALTTWKKPLKERSIDLLTGDSIDYDIERLYVRINQDKKVIGQYLTFDNLTIDVDFFNK